MPPCHGGGRGFESRPVRKKLHYMVKLFLFMACYVYIIQSLVDESYYKGFTEDPKSRIAQHNSGLSSYTSRKMPWKYIYLELFDTKKEALIREKILKKYSHTQIEQLVMSLKNKLNTLY
jgi:putative endonuclease